MTKTRLNSTIEDGLTVPEHLERQTSALVKWIGVVDRDEDGDPEYGEVDPNNDPNAELRPYCSAVWVTNDIMITAEHCVHDLGKPKEDWTHSILRKFMSLPEQEWDPTGQSLSYSAFGDIKDEHGRHFRSSHDAIVFAVDQQLDLALVKAKPDIMNPLPDHEIAVVATEAHVGDEVHIMGHVIGMWWTYTHGWISQFRPESKNADNKKVDAIQISAPVWFGNSGGGAFSKDGKLLGIVSWLTRSAPNVGFFVDFRTVRAFLNKNGIKS
jgi:hypothetical protein